MFHRYMYIYLYKGYQELALSDHTSHPFLNQRHPMIFKSTQIANNEIQLQLIHQTITAKNNEIHKIDIIIKSNQITKSKDYYETQPTN